LTSEPPTPPALPWRLIRAAAFGLGGLTVTVALVIYLWPRVETPPLPPKPTPPATASAPRATTPAPPATTPQTSVAKPVPPQPPPPEITGAVARSAQRDAAEARR